MEFLKNIYFNALQICVTNAIGTAVASKDATVFYCLPNTTPDELKSFIFEQEAKARLCFIIAKDWNQILDTLKAIFIFIEAGGGAVFNENKWFLKKTTWFKMNTAYKEQLIPQAIEQIEAVEWVPMKKITTYINEQSFGTLQEVISALL